MPSASFAQTRFAALRSPDFRNLWFGQIISAAGSMMQMAALNWQIYDLTNSPVALGGIGLVRVIPIIVVQKIKTGFEPILRCLDPFSACLHLACFSIPR